MEVDIRQTRYTQRQGLIAIIPLILAWFMLTAASTLAGDNEYNGKFEPQLVANQDDLEQVIFRPLRDLSKIKFAKPLPDHATITAGRLYHAPSDKSAILTLLVEEEGEDPVLYADVNQNNAIDENERFELKRGEDNNPYIWESTINQPLKEGLFQSFPLFVQYFKNVQMDDLKEGE